MRLADLYKVLSDAGITLTTEDDSLRVHAPRGAVTPAILAHIKTFKPDLIRSLQRSAEGAQHIPFLGNPRPQALSYAQQRLWLLDQIDDGSTHYHISGAMRLSGSVDVRALSRTFSTLLERHESLRTCFRTADDGEPLQIVQPAVSVSVPLIDLTAVARGEQERRLLDHLQAEAGRPFDLSHDILLRAVLFRMELSDHVLLVTMHHIASDGWSLAIVQREFGALYTAYVQGRDNPLPPLTIQYADFAHWQRQTLRSESLQKKLHDWCREQAGLPVVHSLPLDFARPAVQSFSGATLKSRIERDSMAALKALCREAEATLFMGLHAVFAVLLARHSNERDIVVGSPIANREHPDLAQLIGFFVNSLVLRSDLSGSPSFTEMLRQSRQVLSRAYEHQQVPFEQIVERLQPQRSASHSPLFQIMLALQNNESAELILPGLVLRRMELPEVASKYDLTLSITETVDALELTWEYNTDLFHLRTIVSLAEHFAALLCALVSAPARSVFEAGMLSEDESRLLMSDFNTPRSRYPDGCLQELFELRAAEDPHAPAVTFGKQCLTYGELNARANRLAHHLREFGIRPDCRIAICVERSVDMLVGILAILKAGAAYVPLDPAYPAERLSFMLRDSMPTVVVGHAPTQETLSTAMMSASVSVPVIDLDLHADQWAAWPDTNCSRDCIGLTPSHLAYVIYTSGSTGTPKGVMVEHANVARLLAATEHGFKFGRNDTWTLFHSFAFDFSVWEIWGALAYGGRLVIVPQQQTVDPAQLYRLLCHEGVTVLNLTPSVFRLLLNAQREETATHRLRYVIFGGEALDVSLLRPWYRDDRNHAAQLINMYGITETTVHVTYCPLVPDDVRQGGGSPIGGRIQDLSIYLLDEWRNPVPLGVVGEIYVGGAGVTRGYLNRPELTAQRFIASPFVAGERLYKSGDLARYLPDGKLQFLGRNDFQVKVRGFRIELGEIEARLRAHPAVKESAVLAQDDGVGDKRLIAYYTSHDGKEVGTEALFDSLVRLLPEYMVPGAYVHLQQLPLTPNCKLDRNALPSPDRNAYVSSSFEPPHGVAEEKLAGIWQDLLAVEKVGRHDSFFELGGHSLLVCRLVSRINTALGTALPIATIFRHPTIAQLSTMLSSAHTPAKDSDRLALYREGDPEVAPMVLVHPVGGSSVCYGDLIRSLVYPGAIWAFDQNEATLAAETTHSIKGLAELYVSTLLARQKWRSVCLFGWSFGGVVAYEMASLLERTEVAVRWLGMVDSYPQVQIDDQSIRRHALAIYAYDLGFSLDIVQAQRDAENISIESAMNQLLMAARRSDRVPIDTTVDNIAETCRYIEENLRRLRTYEPSTWRGELHYYRALRSTKQGRPEPSRLWGAYGPVLTCEDLDTDHYSIIKGAHARTLAGLVSRALDGVTA